MPPTSSPMTTGASTAEANDNAPCNGEGGPDARPPSGIDDQLQLTSGFQSANIPAGLFIQTHACLM